MAMNAHGAARCVVVLREDQLGDVKRVRTRVATLTALSAV